jgi:hypothetical protein
MRYISRTALSSEDRMMSKPRSGKWRAKGRKRLRDSRLSFPDSVLGDLNDAIGKREKPDSL